MVAETFKLSSSLKVIQQPYLRVMKKMQGLLCLSLKCSQLWGEVKYLFNYNVMFHCPRFPVQALTGHFSIAHVFLLTCHQLLWMQGEENSQQGSSLLWETQHHRPDQDLAYVILIVAGIVALTSSFVASASDLHFRSSVTDWKPQWDFQKYSGVMLILSYSSRSYPRVSKK